MEKKELERELAQLYNVCSNFFESFPVNIAKTFRIEIEFLLRFNK